MTTMNYDTEQSRIDREQFALKILRIMLQYSDIDFSTDVFLSMFKTSSSNIQDALSWLCMHGFVGQCGDSFNVLNGAMHAYRDHTNLEEFKVDVHEFRTEALTGMDSRGKRSKLTWAALPSPNKPPTVGNYEEVTAISRCTKMNMVRQIAEEVCLTMDETLRGLESGMIKLCSGTNKQAQHWGIFNKKNRGWQHRCMKCMSEIFRDIRKRKRMMKND
jgi:hypothetical protein